MVMVKEPIGPKIVDRMEGRGRGSAVTANDFLDLGSRDSVDQALSRLVKQQTLIRVDRGIYAYPKVSRLIGAVGPTAEEIAQAMARRGSQRLLPSGAMAANLLGLSDQVPAKVEYLTDGAACERRSGKLLIRLKPTTPKNMATADRVTGPVIQALRYLGKDNVGDQVVSQLRQRLSEQDRLQLVEDISFAPGWMAPIFKKIAEKEAVV